MNQSLHLSLLVERLLPLSGPPGPGPAVAVRAAREFLDMDVAVITEFRADGHRVLRHVEGRNAFQCPLEAGAVLPLEEGYCLRMIRGELPGLIPDTSREPAVADLPATRAMPIGAYLGVPIRLPDGALYGSFCCFSFQPDPRLTERELELLGGLAERVGGLIAEERLADA